VFGIDPRSGSWALGQDHGSDTNVEVAQDVDVSGWATVIDGGTAEVRGRSWIAGRDADTGGFKLTFLAADGATVLGTEGPAETDPTTSYEQVEATASIPAGTRVVRISLVTTRVSNSQPQVAHNDATLEIRPGLTKSFAFTVYQMSGQVSRGFPGTGQVQPA